MSPFAKCKRDSARHQGKGDAKVVKSTQLLMADHEIILHALHVLDAMNADIESGRDMKGQDIQSLLTFLRDFADGCHHVKEEAIFFPALMQAGMPAEEGPLRVMNYEHERGRSLVAAMQNALVRNNKPDFLIYSRRYVDLLSQHIEKEQSALFGKAEQILNDDEDDKIVESFEHYENVIIGALVHERLHHIIEALTSKYLTAAECS
jgi:hemerythrin-like domain-containing protein